MDGYAIVVRRLPVAQTSEQDSLVGDGRESSSAIKSRVSCKLGGVALNLTFVLITACAAIMLIPAVLGFHRYVILTGSMTGTYDRGSIVFDRPVPVSRLKVGDPITYDPPPGFSAQKRLTHRIWWIGRGANGERLFRTKGDANKSPDIWKFTLSGPTQDRVTFSIPYVGFVFELLSLRNFRMVLVGVPALIIGLMILRGLWRDAGDEARRKELEELGWQQIVDPGLEIALAPIDAPATEHVPPRVDLGSLTTGEGSWRALRRPAADRPRLERGATLLLGRLTGSRDDVAAPASRSALRRAAPRGGWELHVRRA